MADGDPLATLDDGAARPRPPILCEFCGSKLTRRGEVLEMSDKAKQLRRLQDTIDKLERTIADKDEQLARLTAENADFRRQMADPETVDQPVKSGGFFDDDDDD